ncbi:hypothetical protein [Staphylococcus phage PMBT8]|nr:hypothetical protein [Staphylococcus phage PMBT8]
MDKQKVINRYIYMRRKKYFKNFQEKYKKEIDKMYHIC